MQMPCVCRQARLDAAAADKQQLQDSISASQTEVLDVISAEKEEVLYELIDIANDADYAVIYLQRQCSDVPSCLLIV